MFDIPRGSYSGDILITKRNQHIHIDSSATSLIMAGNKGKANLPKKMISLLPITFSLPRQHKTKLAYCSLVCRLPILSVVIG